MKRITFGLSVKEIKDAQKQLRQYKKDLQKKCRKLVAALADAGITVAQTKASGNEMGKYLLFRKDVSATTTGARAIIYATQTGLIRSEWRTGNNATGIVAADVSPLLMAEFGAGIAHDHNPKASEFGMGAGTFPGQTHAMNPSGWYYMDLDYEWHWSDGIEPTMPMYTAAMHLRSTIVQIAKGVFNS